MTGRTETENQRKGRIFSKFAGVTVCCLFFLQAAWEIASLPSGGFASYCRWFGDWFLHVVAGIAGCYIEFVGNQAATKGRRRKYKLNRLSAAVFDLWMGSYAIGTKSHDTLHDVVSNINGATAFILCFLNITLACECSKQGTLSNPVEAEERGFQEPEVPNIAAEAQLGQHVNPFDSQVTFASATAHEVSMSSLPSQRVSGSAPASGWNSSFDKGFGTG